MPQYKLFLISRILIIGAKLIKKNMLAKKIHQIHIQIHIHMRIIMDGHVLIVLPSRV